MKKGLAEKERERSSLQIYYVSAPFERVQMNILDSLPIFSSGNQFFLVIIDCFTKRVETFPLKNFRAENNS